MSVVLEERVTYRDTPAMRVTFAVPDDHGRPSKEVGLFALDCGYCERQRDKQETFFPSHWASDRCESGKRNHCSCDACF